MRTTLVTGATRGLGRQTARELVAAGYTVYLGARDAAHGEAAARQIGGRPLPLDVTSDASVRAAAEQVREQVGHLDVLVNNAGIPGTALPAGEIGAADLAAVFDTNVFGVVRVMRAFLPLLAASAAPVVVNVSSGLGSLAVAADPARHRAVVPVWLPALAYGSAKAALNMLTLQYAHAFPDLRINAVDPGYTATDFNGRTGTQPVEQGAAIIVRMAMIGTDGPTGGYFARAVFTNTFHAHHLLAQAAGQGRGEQMAARLFRAYFTEGQYLNDPATLARLAAEVGVAYGPGGEAELRAELDRVRALGVESVPVFDFGNGQVLTGERIQAELLAALAGEDGTNHPASLR